MAVHNSAASFAEALQGHKARIRLRQRRRMRDTVKAVIAGVLGMSPVDTSFFRSNWAVVDKGQDPPVARFGTREELDARLLSGDGPSKAARRRAGRTAQSERISAQVVTHANARADGVTGFEDLSVANATTYGVYIDQGNKWLPGRHIIRSVAQAVRLRLRQSRP